ncbi:MAG TPA: hypothetical protein PKN54_00885 [Candidatus Cloacimonas acidaminovorans]|jgi:hypothetical protein|nr:hypothetical protein [Candidatus Cloacimonas acidaminovorans]HNZ88174.1 hypothetical protein [Candidatus Cloacimonas acidaminovorans]HOI01271.1 hypothetical protein [Candidatus Cloacimonas acidaminovorans]HPU99387.1 hypothetical protein [Candidatus Cloacimonas acidaminovorans]
MTETYWPETVIFWGAGATNALGFPSTSQQGEFLINISQIEFKEDYLKRLSGFFRGNYLKEMTDLLYVLDLDISSDKSQSWMVNSVSKGKYAIAQSLFKIKDNKELENLIITLRYNYDFFALKQILKLCSADSNSIVLNVFNLIDYHISNNEGFYVYIQDKEKCFLNVTRLIGARNALLMLMVSCFTATYLEALQNKKETINKYRVFADKLTKYMFEEAKRRQDYPKKDRQFYLFSYAIISMNWDHFLNWMIFQAHKDFNDESNDGFAGRHIKLKFFNDFAVMMGLRELLRKNVDKELSTKIWYPFNESIVPRINDEDHISDRIVRLGKYYYPHGCLAWRICPNCGSVTGNFGDLWDIESKSLFPPSLFSTSRLIKNRSANEKKWVEQGLFDAIECSYCGAKTELKDTPLIMQTSVKTNIPPVLRMIQSDINACLENAKHIIFMGYSLPEDDYVWRSILLARKNDVKCSVVLGCGGPNRWQKCDNENCIEIGKYKADRKKFKHFFDLFSKDALRFNTYGIPDIFDDMKIEDLFKFS